MISIRHARKEDAQAAIPLFLTVYSGFASILAEVQSEQEVMAALIKLFQDEKNRLSYQNMLVAEGEMGVVGLLLAYLGSQARELDQPLIDYMRGVCRNSTLTLDREAEENEFYIDTVVVASAFANQGIGTRLMGAAERWAQQLRSRTLSLNVHLENNGAYRLYQRLGYVVQKEIAIANRRYYHMVKHVL